MPIDTGTHRLEDALVAVPVTLCSSQRLTSTTTPAVHTNTPDGTGIPAESLRPTAEPTPEPQAIAKKGRELLLLLAVSLSDQLLEQNTCLRLGNEQAAGLTAHRYGG